MNDDYPYGPMGHFDHSGDERGYRQQGQQNRQRNPQREGGRGDWPDRPNWRSGAGLRNQDSYGAPDRDRAASEYGGRQGYGNRDQDNRGYGNRERDNEGWRGYVDEDGYRSRPPRGNWGSADEGGDYRGDTAEGGRYGQWSGREHWGQQGYGQPYSHRDWGERSYREDNDRQAERGSGYGRQEAGGYDESRSSQGNRHYPGLGDAYTGETHGREWGAFGGAGWGTTGTSGGVWEAGGLASGRHHRGRGPKGYERSDERIKEEICERLTHDPHIDASDISIECRAGVVILEGSIERRSLKHRVEDMVDAVSGVRDIQNRLKVPANTQSVPREDMLNNQPTGEGDTLSQPRNGEDSQVAQGNNAQRGEGQQAGNGTTAGTPADTRSTQHTTSSTRTRQ